MKSARRNMKVERFLHGDWATLWATLYTPTLPLRIGIHLMNYSMKNINRNIKHVIIIEPNYYSTREHFERIIPIRGIIGKRKHFTFLHYNRTRKNWFKTN